MGNPPMQDLHNDGLSISIWERDGWPDLRQWTYEQGDDLPYAGFTCDNCPQPLVTHTALDTETRDYTKRCTDCARTHQAHKRVRRLKELFANNRPSEANACVAITLTFADEQIDKEQKWALKGEALDTLRRETVKRFSRLRERSEWWNQTMLGGISSWECTRKTGNYHPHLHIVAWSTLTYPYPLQTFRDEMMKHGFGMMCTIETAYTKTRAKNPDGTYKKDSNGDYVTYKNHSDPEGALWYALKYALKDSLLGAKKGRTVTKFGNLYGKKWSADMSAYKPMFEDRYRARNTWKPDAYGEKWEATPHPTEGCW